MTSPGFHVRPAADALAISLAVHAFVAFGILAMIFAMLAGVWP